MTQGKAIERGKQLQGLKLLLLGEDERRREREDLHAKARSVGPSDDRNAWLETTREIAKLFSEHATVSAEISRLIRELAPSDADPPLDDNEYGDLRERLLRTLPADGTVGEGEAWQDLARTFAKTAEGLGGVVAHARETLSLCAPDEAGG